MKVLILLAVVALACASYDFSEEWEAWREVGQHSCHTYNIHVCHSFSSSPPHSLTPSQEHNKKYNSLEEEVQRHAIWQANMKYIDAHNEYADVFGFTLKMNEFGDLVRPVQED